MPHPVTIKGQSRKAVTYRAFFIFLPASQVSSNGASKLSLTPNALHHAIGMPPS
jgi:hypothetical protein